MPLRIEHLTAIRASWRPKHESIAAIARELDLGLDSFVFLDDNPVEIAAVAAALPDVHVLHVPPAAEVEGFLAHVWAFDRLRAVTAEDAARAGHYRSNVAREQLRAETTSLREFLAGLRLEVSVAPMVEEEAERVAQLTQRTNQFNCSTRRRTEKELLAALTPAGPLRALTARVRDRFGDYGLVGVVLHEPRDGALSVDTFLLSCRALGRGVEHRILAELAAIAEAEGLGRLDIAFAASARNEPAAAFLAANGTVTRRGVDTLFTVELAAARTAFDRAGAVVAAPAPTETRAAPAVAHATRLRALDLAITRRDARALAAALCPANARAGATAEWTAPRTDIEQAVAEVWSAVLRVERVGAHDDFFALGGSSVSAVGMLSQLATRVGVELPLRSVFDHPTLEALAEAARRVRETEQPDLVPPPIHRSGAEGGSTTSFMQDVLLAWERARSPSTTWNHQSLVEIEGPLDADRLEGALRRTLIEEEALRFVADRVHHGLCATDAVSVERVDLRGRPAEDLEAVALRHANQPFVFDGSPLVRFAIVQRGPTSHALLAGWHQAVHDPGSGALVTNAVLDRYVDPRSAPPALRYVDYALWEKEWFRGPGRALVDAARARLAGLDGSPCVDHPDGDIRDPTKVDATLVLDVDQTQRFFGLCREESVTAFIAVTAVLGALLGRRFGRQDIPILGPAALRNLRPELAPMVGRFISLVSIRATTRDATTWRDLFRRTRTNILEVFAAQSTPLPLVFDTSDVFAHPFGRVTLNYLGAQATSPPVSRRDGLVVTERHVTGRHGARNDLFFAMGTSRGKLFANVGAAAARVDARTVSAIADELGEQLRTLDLDATIPKP